MLTVWNYVINLPKLTGDLVVFVFHWLKSITCDRIAINVQFLLTFCISCVVFEINHKTPNMNNVNLPTNLYFHSIDVEQSHSSQHVDTGLTRNACSLIQPIIPVLSTNGYNTIPRPASLWSFSNTSADSEALLNSGNGSQEIRGNEQATTNGISTNQVYSWMKKKRGKNGQEDENSEGRR